MDLKIVEFLMEDAPKFVKLIQDIEVLIENVKDPHEKNILLELLDILEEISPRLNSILEDLKDLF